MTLPPLGQPRDVLGGGQAWTSPAEAVISGAVLCLAVASLLLPLVWAVPGSPKLRPRPSPSKQVSLGSCLTSLSHISLTQKTHVPNCISELLCSGVCGPRGEGWTAPSAQAFLRASAAEGSVPSGPRAQRLGAERALLCLQLPTGPSPRLGPSPLPLSLRVQGMVPPLLVPAPGAPRAGRAADCPSLPGTEGILWTVLGTLGELTAWDRLALASSGFP